MTTPMPKTPCPTCYGTGNIALGDNEVIIAGDAYSEIECTTCGGEGQVERSIESLMAEACRLDDAIRARMAEYIAPLQDDLAQLKALISTVAIAGGETIRTPYGRIEYVKAVARVTWNDAALLGFAVAHPEILQLRSTKETAPTTRIKFEVKPS